MENKDWKLLQGRYQYLHYSCIVFSSPPPPPPPHPPPPWHFSRPRKRKCDLNPLKCISYIHEEYIRPICEQSGLPGLCYTAGPVVDDCTGAAPPHSVGVLAAVCYPGNGSTDIETLGKCGTCGEEYDINDVLLHTYKRDTSSRNGMLLIQLCKMKNFNRGHVV